MAVGAWRSWLSYTEKFRDFPRPSMKHYLSATLLLFLVSVAYATFTYGSYSWRCPICAAGEGPASTAFYSAGALPTAAAAPVAAVAPTNISHVLFGIGGAVETWQRRRRYSELWWRPGEMRGHVWLDEEPPGGSSSWPSTCPPYRVSENASRYGNHASAARIARIVAEAYRGLIASGQEEEVRWLVMGDDDTVFFPENLVAVLRKYDHEQMWYVGGSSESVEQNTIHSYGMAFGGGGFAISLPAVAELARVLDGCLDRYNFYYGSDQRIHGCLSELGIPLTREHGFHQLDIRGDPFGMLAAHPVAPLVSLHHLDYVNPISPWDSDRVGALGPLVRASRLDPARTLQQAICYDTARNWSVSLAWGYTVLVYPRVVFPADLEAPLQTFKTWRSYQDGPFTFNTRPVPPDACDRPVVYFLDTVREAEVGNGGLRKSGRKEKTGNLKGKVHGTVTEYSKYLPTKQTPVCDRPQFVAALKIEKVRIFSPRMDPGDWSKTQTPEQTDSLGRPRAVQAPRRHCCETEVRRSWWGTATGLDVHIRKCRRGETLSPP